MDQTSVEKPTQVTIIIDYKDRCDTVELNAVERVFIESVYNNYNTDMIWYRVSLCFSIMVNASRISMFILKVSNEINTITI